MGKKRKICVSKKINEKIMNNPIYIIVEKSQYNDAFHKKYIKELKKIYEKMKHNKFFESLKKIIMKTMLYDFECDNANRILLFCAQFLTSFDCENTHSLLISTFNWILDSISESSLVRFRLCEFINTILNSLGTEAILEDCICDEILKYMIERLKDNSPNVRVQAILALHRLQMPDSPNDLVIKSYLFHLSNDPSPRVRQAVITSIARNFHTIPCIIERLWDIDEKVRRHTYLQMSSYSVKLYKVIQRLTFLEQGLKDNSEMVKKVVVKVMLPQWFETYQQSFILFISALKIDANDTEIERFINVSKIALSELFKNKLSLDKILSELPILTQKKENLNNSDGEDDVENDEEIIEGDKKIIPLNQLTIEMVIYWSSVIEYILKEHPDEIDCVLPELTTFCNYISCYCETNKREMDKWEKHVHEYILLLLIEILSTYDLGDETGRTNLMILLKNLLCHYELDERVIKIIIKLYERLLTDNDTRFQYFIDIIHFISDLNMSLNLLNSDRQLIDEIIKNHPDKDIEIKISTLKLKILDLRERESRFVEKKDYVNAQKIAEELITYNEEFSNLLNPLLSDHKDELRKSLSEFCSQIPKKVTNETTIKCLQIAYYMIVSTEVRHITPNVCVLYKDFIRRNVESAHLLIREWSLKLSTAISMHYEILAKEVFTELNLQFFKTSNTRIWKTTVQCTFELLDRFGFKFFDIDENQRKDKKKLRQLFNNIDYAEGDEEQAQYANGTELMLLMSHFLETCDELSVVKAIVEGFSRLILRGHYTSNGIVSKLLLKYFNPATDSEINQILGLLFEKLITHKKQELLAPSLLPTLYTILEAPNESPLQDIKPQIILKFVIDSTRPQYSAVGLNIHNTLAISFINALLENIKNKILIKLLSKELLKLEISDDPVLKNDLIVNVKKIIDTVDDKKLIKDIIQFNNILDGKLDDDDVLIKKNINKNPDENNTDIETINVNISGDNNLIENSFNTNQTENDESEIKSKSNVESSEAETTVVLTDTVLDAEKGMDNSVNSICDSQEKPDASQNSNSSIKMTPEKRSSYLRETPTRLNRLKAKNAKEIIIPKDKSQSKPEIIMNNNKNLYPYVKVTPLSKSILKMHLYGEGSISLYKTRSTTKRQYKENNVITRKRSLEKMYSMDRSIISLVSQSSPTTPISKSSIITKLVENKCTSRLSRIQVKDDDDDEIKSPPRSKSKTNTNNSATTTTALTINLRNNKKIINNNINNDNDKEIRKNTIILRSRKKLNLQENHLIKDKNQKEQIESVSHKLNVKKKTLNQHNTRSKNNIKKVNKKYS